MGGQSTAERFSSYTYGEGRTGTGQLVKFSCPPEELERVKKFLKENVLAIDIPTTGRVNVGHGGYGRYTRYDITQYKYAGGGNPGSGGFIEVLEIKNPPEGRWGIVIYEYNSHGGSVFSEWETLEDAINAFENCWGGSIESKEKFLTMPGLKRRVVCEALTPWFYAIGDEELIGDFTFPEGLQDDPIYRFGKQFVVFDHDGIPAVKTCMGTRFIEDRYEDYPHKEYHFRLVYWDDGSVWEEMNDRSNPPRPIEEGEAWIAEAVARFRQLLAGKNTEFTINFTDGNKFVGRVVQKRVRSKCAEGEYLLVVRLKGKKEPLEGTVDFKPTKDAPDIIQYVTQRYKRHGQEVEHIEIKECKSVTGGRKWSGVFFKH
jgi:hypothetical protein